METLINKLKEQKLTLSCAESLTCGLFAATLGNISGVSKVFKGGVVTYWAESKTEIIKVSKDTIDNCGVVSKECAADMARGVNEIFNTDISISFTGNAGPNTLEGKPVGLVYIGVYINKIAFTFEYQFEGDRNEIRKKCVEAGVEKLLELL